MNKSNAYNKLILMHIMTYIIELNLNLIILSSNPIIIVVTIIVLSIIYFRVINYSLTTGSIILILLL